MRARRPPDEGTLGADEEDSRDKCFGFWRIKKVFLCVSRKFKMAVLGHARKL